MVGAGLSLGQVTYESMPDGLKGTILRQTPPAGTKIAEGGTISLEVTR
jgi:beta-lactam-binding protein with PASTA domain